MIADQRVRGIEETEDGRNPEGQSPRRFLVGGGAHFPERGWRLSGNDRIEVEEERSAGEDPVSACGQEALSQSLTRGLNRSYEE